MKWNVTTSLLFVSIMGWSVGVVPAVVDGTIAINRVMHNTLWVPGHFEPSRLCRTARYWCETAESRCSAAW